MRDIALDCNFLSNKEAFEKEENKPYAIALAGVMIVTGIYRLFEKDDVYELIKRMQLFFSEEQIIDGFFTNEVLFSFQYKYMHYDFKFKHLNELIGIETLNTAKNKLPYQDWVKGLETCVVMYNMFTIDGVFSGLILDGHKSNELPSYGKPLKTRSICSEQKSVYKANFLAETIANELNSFERLKSDFPNKFKVLQLRTQPVIEPKFDFKKFPASIQNKVTKHFSLVPQTKAPNKLIYLAWLWANDFVIECEDGFCYVDPRVKGFNLKEYGLMGGEGGLRGLLEEYSLRMLFPLLIDPTVQ